MYSREKLNEIKSKINYFDWYKQYLPDLVQRGRLAWCCCLWHQESKPSFSVDTEYGMFKCWGENISGDIFSFYMKHFGVSFSEAVQDIAEQVGVTLEIDPEVQKELELKKNQCKANKIICDNFVKRLQETPEALNYLINERGFTRTTINLFKLGVGIDNLHKMISPEKLDGLYGIGLVKKNEDGTYKSTFKSNRITIPRIDEKGDIVSFSGRIFIEPKDKDKQPPKYLHTTNNALYDKSKFVFGLYQAKKHIKNLNSVIICEGECFKPDAEILTPNGWVRFDEYKNEDVMQVNDDLTSEFVKPLAKIIKDYSGELLECNNRNCKITATPNHNIVCKGNKKLYKKKFKDINSQISIPTSVTYSGKGVDITDDMIRLLIAIQADGSIDIRKTKDNYIRVAFSKKRKIERFEYLLNINNIKYIKSNHKNNKTFFGFSLKNAFKTFPNEWLQMTQSQLNILLEEILYWDGNKVPNRSQIEYSTKDINNAKFIQTVAHLCGYSSSIINRSNKFGSWYKVSILYNKNTVTLRKECIKSTCYTGKVYCVEVPSGKILVRINGKISVIGNCDAMKCHQVGVTNSVALSGLNISDEQVNLLKKYTDTFYVCVEDNAILRPNDKGETSLDKFYNKVKQHIPYAKVYIIDLRGKNGEKCDPDMYFENHTKDEFKQLIKQAKIYNEYIISSKLTGVNPKNIEEKTACLNMLVPMLISIQNFMDRKQYIELVANKLMISENDIYRKIKYYTEKQDKINAENITWDTRPIFAQKILLSMCFCNNFDVMLVLGQIALKAKEYFEPFYKSIFEDYIYKYAYNWVKEHGDVPIDFTDFFTEINSENTNNLIRKTIMDAYFKAENLEDFTNEDVEELINEQLESLTEYDLPTYETDELECLSA